MIRILIADDEPMIRAGIRAVLATDPGIAVVAEAADGHQAVELAQRHRPQVAVLDIRMPGTGGLEAAVEIRRTDPPNHQGTQAPRAVLTPALTRPPKPSNAHTTSAPPLTTTALVMAASQEGSETSTHEVTPEGDGRLVGTGLP